MMNHDEEGSDDYDFEPAKPQRTTRKRGGKATETVITKRELVDEDEKRPTQVTFAALFDAGPEDANDETVLKVRVTRMEPSEGQLGYIEDMDATEELIKERWGGSKYRLDGINRQGRIVRVRTITIAGDPIFVSESFDIQWRKQRGLPPRSQTNGEQVTIKDMLAIIEAKEAALRKEISDKEERDRKERQEREAERRREEREWQAQREREQREFDERRRKEREEAEERRRRDDDEREQRRRRDLEESTKQQQQFMQQMLTIVSTNAQQSITLVKEMSAAPKGGETNPADMLIKGIQLALQLKGGDGEGEKDLLTTVVENLPQMLNAAGNAVGKAVREVKGGATSHQPRIAATPEGSLVLPPGVVSQKFAALVQKVAEQGGDPEQALNAIADKMLAAPGTKRLPVNPPQVEATPSRPVVMDPGPANTEAQSTTPPPSSNPQVANIPGVTRMKFGKKG